MKSWKTTASGIVSAAASFIMFLSSQGVYFPHWLVLTAGYILVGGLASLGIVGRDHTYTLPKQGTDSGQK